MRWNSGTDGATCFLHLACPQVCQRIAAFILRKARGRRSYGDCLRLTAGVEQTDNCVSVCFLLRQNTFRWVLILTTLLAAIESWSTARTTVFLRYWRSSWSR